MSFKILILDDEVALSESMSELLLLRYESKVSVDRAFNIADFEDFVKINRYDAIVADFNLPDGVGYKSMVKMLDICPWISDCLIIFISGIPYVDLDPDFKNAQGLFKNAFVRNKPLHSHLLYEMIDKEMER
ncbi:MAG: hypothetical protein COB02_14285 [Candidatus Cloacimonadota bacterium]|nr:MAG: hypothetical protein COB02_14285 [Candidatus Cloacimonadota bacterium]